MKPQWRQLVRILATDEKAAEILNSLSADISMILIRNVSEVEHTTEVHDPVNDQLFAGSDCKTIYSKDISYELNHQAQTFGNLFKINLNKYIVDNYRANSCYVNLIVDTYKKAFEKRKSDGKRCYKELTYDSVCQIMGLECKSQDLGLSIRQSLAFFEKFRLGLDVINVYSAMLYTYTPNPINTDLSPSRLRILIHNNHCYKLDDSARFKLQKLKVQTQLSNDLDEINSLVASNKFHIRKPLIEDLEIHYIENLDDCIKFIHSCKTEKIRFITNNSMTNLLFDMIWNNHVPGINASNNKILSLTFSVGKILATVESSDITAPDDSEIQLPDLDSYRKYHEHDDYFYQQIINESVKSEYSQQVLEIEDEYKIGPLCGYIDQFYQNKEFNALDMVKAYTHNLMQIDEVPVFGYFDQYQKYGGHIVEDLTQYIVYCVSKTVTTTILFPAEYSRCYGLRLKIAEEYQIKFEILAFRRPFRTEKVNYKGAVEELYRTDLSIEEKKHIVNKTTGLTEKKYNTAHICKVFYNLAEAQYYQVKYGGKLHSLSSDIVKQTKSNEPNSLDYGIDNSLKTDFEYNVNFEYNKKIYLLIVEKKETLIDGFRQIKEMIYDIQAIKLFSLYNDVIQKGITPVGIKTDAILVKSSRVLLEKYFQFDETKIGALKFESGKTLINKKIVQEKNKLMEFPEISINNIPLKDEYDTKAINGIFDAHNRILIKGVYPGVGKTTSVINFTNHKILFVTPWNSLAQDLQRKGHKAITLNMLLGIFADGKEYTKAYNYDINPYDCICFDEIFLYEPKRLKKIDIFMKQHSSKIYFATGDVDQLPPIDFEVNNILNLREYQKTCINQMFPNQLELNISKRLKSEEDRNKLKDLKKEIFENPKNIIKILEKYNFKTCRSLKEVKTFKNICYFNFRTDTVNTHAHSLVAKPEKSVTINKVPYWEGLKLFCKKHYKVKSIRLFVNYLYKIQKISSESFTICDEVENTTFTLPIDVLSHFKLLYANTCHSVQGTTINELITIFDVNTPYVDPFYIWTALTRATDFNNVTVFLHGKNEVNSLGESKIKQYFNGKVESYKLQDKKGKRPFDDKDYVDVAWINQKFQECKKCSCCHVPFEVHLTSYNVVQSNFVVDRIDSDIAHIKSNCRLLCHNCNCAKGNRYKILY
jgi:hypothetical protein